MLAGRFAPLTFALRDKTKRMQINNLDHLVLTVKDVEKTVSFYESVLGMNKMVFGEGRVALKTGKELEPKANNPIPGSADLCFITSTPITEAMDHVTKCGVEIIDGPVERTGANGSILSFYFRDPDRNLIEVANAT